MIPTTDHHMRVSWLRKRYPFCVCVSRISSPISALCLRCFPLFSYSSPFACLHEPTNQLPPSRAQQQHRSRRHSRRKKNAENDQFAYQALRTKKGQDLEQIPAKTRPFIFRSACLYMHLRTPRTEDLQVWPGLARPGLVFWSRIRLGPAQDTMKMRVGVDISPSFLGTCMCRHTYLARVGSSDRGSYVHRPQPASTAHTRSNRWMPCASMTTPVKIVDRMYRADSATNIHEMHISQNPALQKVL